MKRRSHLLAAASLVAGLATTAQAEELGTGLSLSSNVAITSNYIFRGISRAFMCLGWPARGGRERGR